jgi:hypothetical protein
MDLLVCRNTGQEFSVPQPNLCMASRWYHRFIGKVLRFLRLQSLYIAHRDLRIREIASSRRGKLLSHHLKPYRSSRLGSGSEFSNTCMSFDQAPSMGMGMYESVGI